MSNLVGLEGLPSHDHCGYKVAIQMLVYSKRPGENARSHLQFETIRKLRSAYSNHVRASPQSNQEAASLGDVKGNYQRFSTDPCGSFWYYRFVKGLKYRMGQEWRPNKGMSIELYLKVLEGAEEEC